jgi:hypothetical protein
VRSVIVRSENMPVNALYYHKKSVVAAGGADGAAAVGGVATKVHSIQAKGGKRKAGDMTPSDTPSAKVMGATIVFLVTNCLRV